jgi:DNA end-binding protein Ku
MRGPRQDRQSRKAHNALKLPSLRFVDSLAFALRLWLLYLVASESPVPASRPYWKGYLKLSFVSCPIALYPAISAAERISFRQVNRRTGHRLKHKLVDSVTGQAVDAADKARGYEVGENDFLLVEDRDLERARRERPAPGEVELAAPPSPESPPTIPASPHDAAEGDADYEDEDDEQEETLARPQNRRTIEIERFLPAGQVDARYFEKPYYIVPREEISQESFAVIRDAMSREAVVGLARVVLSSRERPILLEPTGHGLLGVTLRFAQDIRNEADYFSDIPEMKLPSEMMKLAQHIIRTKSADFDPAMLEDHYRRALVRILRRKQAKRPLQPPAVKPSRENVVSLMDALRRSVAAERPAKPARRRGPGKPATGRRGARHRSAV